MTEVNFQLKYRNFMTEQEINEQIPYKRYAFIERLEMQLKKEQDEQEEQNATES